MTGQIFKYQTSKILQTYAIDSTMKDLIIFFQKSFTAINHESLININYQLIFTTIYYCIHKTDLALIYNNPSKYLKITLILSNSENDASITDKIAEYLLKIIESTRETESKHTSMKKIVADVHRGIYGNKIPPPPINTT